MSNLRKLVENGMYRQKKLVNAYPMGKYEYCELRSWTVPDDEDPREMGIVIVSNEGEDDEHICWKSEAEFYADYELATDED